MIMKELLKQREELKEQLEEMEHARAVFVDKKKEIDQQIMDKMKLEDLLSIRYGSETVSIGVRKGFKIVDEKKAISFIPKSLRQEYFKLDSRMLVTAVKEYTREHDLPEGFEAANSKYVSVRQTK